MRGENQQTNFELSISETLKIWWLRFFVQSMISQFLKIIDNNLNHFDYHKILFDLRLIYFLKFCLMNRVKNLFINHSGEGSNFINLQYELWKMTYFWANFLNKFLWQCVAFFWFLKFSYSQEDKSLLLG